jgi:hypothetical protein
MSRWALFKGTWRDYDLGIHRFRVFYQMRVMRRYVANVTLGCADRRRTQYHR